MNDLTPASQRCMVGGCVTKIGGRWLRVNMVNELLNYLFIIFEPTLYCVTG